MLKKGLTNREFARMMDKDEGQVSHWVNGVHVPFKRTRKIICEVLQVEIEKLDSDRWAVNLNEERQDDNYNDIVREAASNDRVFELLKEERSRYGIEDIPDTEMGRHLQSALDDAVSLVIKLRRLVDLDRNDD